MTFELRGAKYFATSAEVAAVRKAVNKVISLNNLGYPVSTSASSPKAVTVCKPFLVFFGCPFTYLKPYNSPSLVGINSITPTLE